MAVPPGALDVTEGAFRVVKLVLVGVEKEGGVGFLGENTNITHRSEMTSVLILSDVKTLN